MTSPIVVGLDVGTSNIKIAVAKQLRPEKDPSVVALGVSRSEGFRKGVVNDLADATRSIVLALEQASKMIEEDIKEVTISLNGQHIGCLNISGKVAVSRADGEVTQNDMDRVIQSATPVNISPNKEIVDIIPKTFTLDEESGIKNPAGMNGIRLEVEALLIEASSSAIKNTVKCVEAAKLQVVQEVVSPIAASYSVLDKKQKELGVMVLDIGGGNTSMAVYEEGKLVHIKIIPLGALDITKDLAIGLRTSIEVAEIVKIKYGLALRSGLSPEMRKQQVDLSKIDANETGVFSIYRIAEIIEYRLLEIFEFVYKELQDIDRAGFLPAGVVLVGGGANTKEIIELAKQTLKLPVSLGIPTGVEGSIADIDKPEYATVAGLLLSAFEARQIVTSGNYNELEQQISNPIVNWFKKIMRTFLPTD